MHERNLNSGFTLIELMIVVVVVAILAAVAYPAYQNQVEQGHLSEGTVALTRFASELERCYSRFGSYNDDNCDAHQAALNGTYYSESDTYQITVDDNPNSFEAEAVRKEATSLNKCGTLVLRHTGEKEVDGASKTAEECW
jgi:type IV pilus assembly protein PilE